MQQAYSEAWGVHRHNTTAAVAVPGELRAPRLEQGGQLEGSGDVAGEKQ